MANQGLHPDDALAGKILQLQLAMAVRTGVVLHGCSGSGKSTAIRVLSSVESATGRLIERHYMPPRPDAPHCVPYFFISGIIRCR